MNYYKTEKKEYIKQPNYITVKLYELDNIRKETIDLNSGKDRRRLSHILMHESFRLKSKDQKDLEAMLAKIKSQKKSKVTPLF